MKFYSGHAQRFLFFVTAATLALGQESVVPVGTSIVRGQVWFPGGSAMSDAWLKAGGDYFRPVTGQPFSARLSEQVERKNGDGTLNHYTLQTANLYRDSEGRVRTEATVTLNPREGEKSTSFVEIIDPVAGYRYLLNAATKVAQRSAWPPDFPNRESIERQWKSAEMNAAAQGEPGVEALGTQVVENVLTEGTRRTSEYKVATGTKTETVAMVAETWVSRDLKLNILRKTTDRFSDTTFALKEVQTVEPDATLFQIPVAYVVADR